MATAPCVTLVPADIPGAELLEPLQKHTVPALNWWLACRGITVSSSLRKSALIDKIRHAVADGSSDSVVDVDGSYLHKKYKSLMDAGTSVNPLGPPEQPPHGWSSIPLQNVDAESVLTLIPNLPPVTAGLVYTYLAGHVGCNSGNVGAFRALKKGYIMWASGWLEKIEVNTNRPDYCHVRSVVLASMKDAKYLVYLLLHHPSNITALLKATCPCAAGLSSSCTHVSAVLHALVDITPKPSSVQNILSIDEDDEAVPVTSKLCTWNQPKKRKESTLPMAEAAFKKHDYSKPNKKNIKLMEDFDPRPLQYRGMLSSRLPAFLDSVQGQNLCVSLIFDEKTQHWKDDNDVTTSFEAHVPDNVTLSKTIVAFKESLWVTPQQAHKIEQDTRQQRNSLSWFAVRRYRITSSLFGAVLSRRENTSPDSLVMHILQPKKFFSHATEYGVQTEQIAISKYIEYQHANGHPNLTVSPCGFFVCLLHPFLGASPDGAVYDPDNSSQTFGFVEIKCPYSARDISPEEACLKPNFFCECIQSTGIVCLKHGHAYYSQIQGQMAIGNRPWCDFVVYTSKGLNVERVCFDEIFWNSMLLPKLSSFFDNCVAPEIVSPLHALGLPMRDLSKCNVSQ